jgi:hypothetical protein
LAAPAPRESTVASITPSNVANRVSLRRTSIAFALALAGCVLAYLAFAVHGRWVSPVSDRSYGARELSISRGKATVEADEFVITQGGEGGDTVVSVTTDLRAVDYNVVHWIAIDVPEAAQVALLWHTDYEPSRVNRSTVRVVSGRPMPVAIGPDPHWIGRITGLALVVHGPLPEPVRVRGVVIKPADAAETMRDRVREWTALEPWTGTSINAVTGGADIQFLPLPLLLIAGVAIAGAALTWGARRQLRAAAPSLAVAVAGLLIVAWFVLDARWVFNLARLAQVSAHRYAGKDWREKHLAADDGALFAFIEKVRAALPRTPARVFVIADAHYFRGRAAYHLYPYNVWYEPYANNVPPAERLHAGDWIVVYQRRGVQYDPGQRRLRWDGGATLPVDLKLLDGGDALFLVR